MSAEKELALLLKNLSPVVSEEDYVFVSLPEAQFSPDETFSNSGVSALLTNAKGMFRESEGMTLILDRELAQQHELKGEGPFKCITCEVHSSLDAVGMTAAMSTALSNAGISANVVAAFHHDHIFVQSAKAQRASNVLKALSDRS